MEPFEVTDNGDGSKSIALPATKEAAFEIAHGMALGQYGGSIDNFGFDMPTYGAGTINRTTPFGLNFFNDDISVVDGIPDDPIESMRLAAKYYREDAIAGKVIELMTQFSIAGMRHQLKDEKIRQFFDDWAISVGFNQVLKQVFLEYNLSGNVYVMKTLVNPDLAQGDPDFKYKVDPTLQVKTKAELKAIGAANDIYSKAYAKYINNEIEYDEMFGVQEDCYKKVQAAKKHVWSKSMIPGMYTVIDPKSVEMKGPEAFGLSQMIYKVSTDLKKAITDPTKEQKAAILNLPKDFVKQIKDGSDIILDPNITSRITRMKQDYEPVAFPLMHRAFRSLHMKNRLRELDSATIDTIITQMVIVKVGSKEHPAKPAEMQALAKAWIDAMRSKTLTLFWNHTIEVERVPVQIEILGQEKYETWNNDIRDAFGISPVLMGRVEGAATTGYVSVKGFIENLEQARQDVLEQFVYPEYHGIASAMGFPGYPEVIFDKFNLQDEEALKNMLIKFAQNGILSYETVVDELGFSFKQEIERMTKEAPLKDSGIIRLASANNLEAGSPNGGRPSGQPAKKPKKKAVLVKDKNAK